MVSDDRGVRAEAERGRVVLPNPQRLVLRNFSLYRRRRTVDVVFDREVFCLAGANGLGKSTFLAALSYAMCGAVARPGLNFLGAGDYYRNVLEYSAEYFDGRIDAADHDIAEVEMELTVGDWRFRLVRGMFDPEGLRELQIDGPQGREDFARPDLTDAERHESYKAAICRATGLSDFAQLVFLQLVVLTFDEQRNLLFWTPRVAEQALFLAFGVSAEIASRAEALQRTYDSAESRARNLQWQATGARRRIQALEEAMGAAEADSATDDLRTRHVRLDDQLLTAGERLREAEAARDEAEVTLDDALTRLQEAQAAYDELYQSRVVASRSAHLHPAVIETLTHGRCAVCGSNEPNVAAAVQSALDAVHCPLCSSDLAPQDPGELTRARDQLRMLGEQVVEREGAERVARAELQRRLASLQAADRFLRETSRELETFRQANTQALLRASGEEGMLEEATRGLQDEINELLAQKDRELERRDSAQAALDELRDALAARFGEMEDEFVPLLHDLALEFLGVPLQVDLERRGSRIGLSLSFAGSERRRPEALSESQRFFMDIALRMALARKLASASEPATLYVDTPEGSLDIAYEMRAGRMFARFARGAGSSGNRLIMTANINTSRLLQELAAACGHESMQLIRMTEWTHLSDVQLEAEDAFEQAYATIERRLSGAAA